MSRIVLCMLVLVGSAALAACGGGSSDALTGEEYGQAVRDAGSTLESAFQELATGASETAGGDLTSGEDLEAMLADLSSAVSSAAGSVDAAADDLAQLDAPDDAKDANGQLVEGLRTLAADLERLQAAVEEGDFANVLDLAAGFQEIATSEAGTQIQGAIDELKALGYDVEGAN